MGTVTTAPLLLLFALSPSADPADDVKTLATIRAATRENFTSIHSLQLSFGYSDWGVKSHANQWDWTISGEKFLLSQPGPQKQFPGGPDSRQGMSFDGKKFYQIDFDPDDLTQVRSIFRSSEIPAKYYGAVPLDLLGWRLPAIDQ